MKFDDFRNPDTFLRPAPFWATNDRLTGEETARQMRDFIDAGLSGGFFHSRAGLATQYMGDEWMDAVGAAVQAAKETGGYLWLYDEDLWPSGTAGGQVTENHPEYKAVNLQAELAGVGDEIAEDPDRPVRYVYRIDRDGTQLRGAEAMCVDDARAATDIERLVMRVVPLGGHRSWMNAPFANLLDPDAVGEFIRLTHEKYRERFGDEFGKRIPGIFTDEPKVMCFDDAIPWYEGLPERHRRWRGRDWWDDLPLLFFDAPGCRKVRLLVRRTIHRQYCEAFSKQIGDWCAANGLAFTGHYVAEDNFESQLRVNSGGVMGHYRYMQIPGVDHLLRKTHPWFLAMKQVSSAARQLGRKHVLTEIFGVTRHTNTFEDFRWLGDWDLVNGATLFCPHLSLYSARGRRKRDFPPNWNYQQTYWPELRTLTDYFTRLSSVLISGRAGSSVLLLHAVESAGAGHRFAVGRDGQTVLPKDNSDTERFGGSAWSAMKAIVHAGYQCDFGDEDFLADFGSVDGASLRVGEMSYQVVVVPPSSTWRASTAELLRGFVANGGKIVFAGETPTEVDCEPAGEMWAELASAESAQAVPCSAVQLVAALDRVDAQSFRLRGTDGEPVAETYVHHRVDGETEALFIVNSDRDRERSYELTLRGRADTPLAIWDPLTAERRRVATVPAGDDGRYAFTLPPAGSVLLVVGDDQADAARPSDSAAMTPAGPVLPLPPSWDFRRSEENVLVLDRMSVSVDGGGSFWDEDLEFRQRARLAEHFGAGEAIYWQPWLAVAKKAFEGKGGEVILRYAFDSELDNPRAFAVIEDLSRGRLTVNDQPVDVSDADWHWDRGFGKVKITPHVRRGPNVMEFRFDYDFLTEVEQAYVVGDFGVTLNDPYRGTIVPEPETLIDGTWVSQGYPFYSGTMTYRTRFARPDAERVVLRLRKASGILYKVRLNGAEVGNILWRPHALELTDHLSDGDNELEIEVVSSRQNTLGPLHEKDGDDHGWVGPNAFEDEDVIREQLSLFDYGLLEGAELICLGR